MPIVRATKPDGVSETPHADKARYRWKVVVDPDGSFRSGLFTWEQMRGGGWDEGTIFENVETGARRVWRVKQYGHGAEVGRLETL